MAPLQDPVLLARFRSALANWRVTGYVVWKDIALEWLRSHLEGTEPRQIALLMHQHVTAGGVIDQIAEHRPEWSDYDFHYDFRLPIAGRLIYIETVLVDDDPSDPILRIVSIHDT
jgi:hypothetical protein